MHVPFGNVGWNLFLAAIPAVLGYLISWGLGAKGRRRVLPAWIAAPLALVWLVFLPNTCYLLSEWRHLLIDERWMGVVSAAQTNDPYAMYSLARGSLFFLAYSGLGVMLFVLAVRPIERWLRSVGISMIAVAPFLFWLTSLGVYMGLIVRLNSWDLLNRPAHVIDVAANAVTNTTLLGSITVFAILLWALYEAVDLWVDGLTDRLRQWGLVRAPSGRTANAAA
jgi:uncharacterized membrane protein